MTRFDTGRMTDLRYDRPVLRLTPGTRRVLLLGDSMVVPYAVRAHEGPGILLEQALNRFFLDANVEVVTRAVGGFSFHHYVDLARDMRQTVRPDVIIFYLCENDADIRCELPSGDRDAIARQRWASDAPLQAHFRQVALEAARDLHDIPVLLYSPLHVQTRGTADMDRQLRTICEEVGWNYVTSRSSFGNLPIQRLVATATDGHPSAYAHHVTMSQICLNLSQTLWRGAATRRLDAETLFMPLLDRLAELPVESTMFSGELVRLIDLATQKHLQLSRAVFDTDPHQLAVIAALRQTLIATFNRYADLLGRLARHPQHELSWLTPGSMPLRLFQRVKLLNERVHHGVVQRLEDDPTLPDVPCGPDVDPAAAMGLLATARQALQRIEQILVQCSPADADDLAVDEALPPSLAAACRRLQSRLIQYRHDRLCRIQARQAEIRSLLGDVLAHGREVVQRFETLQLRSDAPTARRAAARSLKQFLDLLGRMTGPALRLPLDGGLPPGKRIYAPRVWQGIEAAPQFLLEVTVCNQVPNSIGLWIDSVLPHGFFADYHQAGEGETTHTYSFPFAVQFLPRLAGTSSFEIRRAVLRYEPTQWQTELTGWKAVMGNLHCPTEAVTVPVEELLIEESMDGDVDECDVPLARRAAG